MDDEFKTTASFPWERAKSIFDKTVELENKRLKAAQAQKPSDPNLWQRIRENYEAIILEDHAFSEQHSIELTLWQLHYKRIEEFRSRIKAALTSSDSSAAQDVKSPSRSDRIAKLMLEFRAFLSEATGFYHGMISKVRPMHGLPLGDFSENQEQQNLADKDGKKLAEIKKGLVSCHRCFIYLGDLARYKGMYGEGDSKNREYASASSYYLQAASLLPASGNPHHQLAIIASYSGDEFAATYRYFRSLAVESPFPTARDNLIVAFEKNRQSYAELLVASKDSSRRLNGKRRGKCEDVSPKNANLVAGSEKDKVTSASEMLKAFCIRFVRLNGILFTRTSLETFSDVLASTSSSLRELISSSSAEELSLGLDTSDSALFLVRLVTILIFSIHNSKRETEGQSYAEVVQRVEPARNSLAASFELLGHIMEQCVQLCDPSSSYFLPGVLVFVEWLACCPDIAVGTDSDDRQITIRNSFWNQCVTFFNQILLLGPMFIDDVEDETCFSNMSLYDERETENRLALWEDYELRGFLPLRPAQTILDFSRKCPFGTEGLKEKKARIKRIIAAGKSLTNVVKINQKQVYFDSKKKKFLVGVKPSDDLLDSHSSPLKADVLQGNQVMMNHISPVMQRDQQIFMGEEDDDEVIVFKPLVTENRKKASNEIYFPNAGFRKPDQVATMGSLRPSNDSDAAFHENQLLQASGNASTRLPASVASNLLGLLQLSTRPEAVHLQQVQTQAVNPQPAQSLAAARLQPMQSQVAQLQPLPSRTVHFQETRAPVLHVSLPQSQSASFGDGSKWVPEEVASLASSLSGFAHMGDGHVMRNEMHGNHGASYYPAHPSPVKQPYNVNGMGGISYYQSQKPEAMFGISYYQSQKPEAMFPPRIDTISSSGVVTDGLGVQVSIPRKNPISRPLRHLGPPPGFNSVPSKLQKEPAPGSDYSRLDGYQAQYSRDAGLNSSLNYSLFGKTEHMGTTNGMKGDANFPFPGIQVQKSQVQSDLPCFLNPQKENIVHKNQQLAQLPEQYQGQPTCSSRGFV